MPSTASPTADSKLYDYAVGRLGPEAAARLVAYTTTTDFKRWFGDWQQTPQAAGRLDANGDPGVSQSGHFINAAGEMRHIDVAARALDLRTAARIATRNLFTRKLSRYTRAGNTQGAANLTLVHQVIADPLVDDQTALLRFVLLAAKQANATFLRLEALEAHLLDTTRTPVQQQQDLRELSELTEYMASFDVITQVMNALQDSEFDPAIILGSNGKVDADFRLEYGGRVVQQISSIREKYDRLVRPLTARFLKAYSTDSTLTTQQLEKMLTIVHADLSWGQRLGDALADSPDQVLALVDRAVSRVRYDVQQQVQTLKADTIIPALTALQEEAKGRGVSADNFEQLYGFMLQKVNGKLTGFYVQPANATPAQQAFYDAFHTHYQRLQQLIPDGFRKGAQLIPILKPASERAFRNGVFQGVGKYLEEKISPLETDTIRVSIDEDGKEFRFLPIHYTNTISAKEDSKLKPEDVTLDMASSLLRFSAMATNYHEMSKVVTQLEAARTLVHTRAYTKTRGDKPLVNASGDPEEFSGADSLSAKRLDDYFEMQVYGNMQADEGSFNFFGIEIDKGKLANNVAAATAISQLGLNIYSAINNVVVGTYSNYLEGQAGRFFEKKDYVATELEYDKMVPGFLKDATGQVPTSRWGILMEHYDLFQEASPTGELIKSKGFLRQLGLNSLFLLHKAGEHRIQTRLMMAMMKHHRVQNGTIYAYHDWVLANNKAFDAASKEEFNKLPTVDSQIETKDGKVVTSLSQNEMFRLTERMKGVYQRLHGNYAQKDTTALNRWAAGRLLGLFRRFLKPAWNRRFQKDTFGGEYVRGADGKLQFVPKDAFDERLGGNVGGYYAITSNYLRQVWRDYQKLGFQSFVTNYGSLPEWKKSAIRQTRMEALAVMGLALMIKALGMLADDDDDNWLAQMTEYQLRRASQEILSFVWVGTATDLLRSPFASLAYFEKVGKTVYQLVPFAGWERYESGPHKGDLKVYWYGQRALPIWGQLIRWSDPGESLGWMKKS